MAINIELIAKSNENWECVNLLMRYKPNRYNAAVSRLYYSIFLLIKCSMANNVENQDLPDIAKMSLAAATGVHFLALKYMRWLDPKLGAKYQVLIRLREQADYDPLPVTQAEFENACKFWSAIRASFAKHLESIGRLMP